jgi:photosystem II stability/assembly factor-like uncharacterized protein
VKSYRSALGACIMAVMLTGCSEWKIVTQSDPQPDMLNAACILDGKAGIAVGEFNVTRSTKDGGKHWIASMGSKTHMYGLYGCSIIDEKTVFATGNNKQALYSTNSGEPWHSMADIEGVGKCISFVSVTEGWVASRVWFAGTKDQGKTWNPIALPEGATMAEALHMTGPGTGYLVSERKDVFFTTDSGAHWEKRANPFAEFKRPFKPLVCRGTQGIAIGMTGNTGVVACLGTIDKDFIVLFSRTDDGGKTWRKPELHTLSREPKTVTASAQGYVTILNKDMSITVFHR